MIATSIWDGIERAEVFERGRYATPNFQGVVAIKKTISKNARNKGMSFIVEFEVIETNMPDEHPVGSKLSWFVKMSNDSAFGNILGWAAACVGIHPQNQQLINSYVRPEIKQAMNMACASPDNNLFTNKWVVLIATPTVMQNGNPFTRYDFEPYDPNARQQFAPPPPAPQQYPQPPQPAYEQSQQYQQPPQQQFAPPQQQPWQPPAQQQPPPWQPQQTQPAQPPWQPSATQTTWPPQR